jgi:hypothetical protein
LLVGVSHGVGVGFIAFTSLGDTTNSYQEIKKEEEEREGKG